MNTRAYLKHLRKQPLPTVYITLDISNDLLQYPLPQNKPRIRSTHLLCPHFVYTPSPKTTLALNPHQVLSEPHLPVVESLGHVKVVRSRTLADEAVDEQITLDLVCRATECAKRAERPVEVELMLGHEVQERPA